MSKYKDINVPGNIGNEALTDPPGWFGNTFALGAGVLSPFHEFTLAEGLKPGATVRTPNALISGGAKFSVTNLTDKAKFAADAAQKQAFGRSLGQRGVTFVSSIPPDIWRSVSKKIAAGEPFTQAEQNGLNSAFATTFKGVKPNANGEYPLLKKVISQIKATQGARRPPGVLDAKTEAEPGLKRGAPLSYNASPVQKVNALKSELGKYDDDDLEYAFRNIIKGKISHDELENLITRFKELTGYNVIFDSAEAVGDGHAFFDPTPAYEAVHFPEHWDDQHSRGIVYEELQHGYDVARSENEHTPEHNNMMHSVTARNLIHNKELWTSREENERLSKLADKLEALHNKGLYR